MSGKRLFSSASALAQLPVLCVACCPCCPPFAADLDRGLCVGSLVTPPCNSAVPPPWHPINAILCYQTKVTVDLRSQMVHPSCESSADGGEGSPCVFSWALSASGLCFHCLTLTPLAMSWCLLLMIAQSLRCLPRWKSDQDSGCKGNQVVRRQFSSKCKHTIHRHFQIGRAHV